MKWGFSERFSEEHVLFGNRNPDLCALPSWQYCCVSCGVPDWQRLKQALVYNVITMLYNGDKRRTVTMSNTSLLQVRTSAEDKEKASKILEKLGTNLSAVVNMMIKQIILTEGIPFEVKMNRPAYTKTEAIKEVEATMAFEGLELTEEDLQMLYAYKNGEASGDELRQQIMGEEENVR
ncbi:MAG: type II toxin-antitoxin system RelB/DinJ family antitoxin [Lachnospiraceae bacterium]|nr:type II toxin-antitoxin system RelB/DinJ family antitoxin [Lachnospiraceae bacterium]